MNTFLNALYAAPVVMLGWYAVHWFSERRALNAERRQWRLRQLEEAYRLLLEANFNDPIHEDDKQKLQSAISRIHLFGSDDQVALSNNMVEEIKNRNICKPGLLVVALSRDIRDANGLEELKGEPLILSFKKNS